MRATPKSSFSWPLGRSWVVLVLVLLGCSGAPEHKYGAMLPHARQMREGSPQGRDELEQGLTWILEQSRLQTPADSQAIPLTMPETLLMPEQ